MNKLLTVAIPTYNRPKELLENLPFLLSQITDECDLLIIDNGSEIDVHQRILVLLNSIDVKCGIKFVRNDNNIGLFANILRCFELSKTKWLYILGDDDKLLSNSISLMLDDIKKRPNFTNIHYKWKPENKWSTNRGTSIQGFVDFADKIESIHHVLFLSSNLYNREKMIRYLHIGHFYQLTSAPHLVMLLMALEKENNSFVYLSDEYIVDNLNEDVDEKTRWSKNDFYRHNNLLIDLPINSVNKKKMFQLFLRSYPITSYFKFYLYQISPNKQAEFIRSSNYIFLYGGIKHKILTIVLRIMLKYPACSGWFLKLFNFIDK